MKRPLLSHLSEKEIDNILNAAFTILETSGVYLPHKEAKKILKKAGAKERDKDFLTIPRELVQQALDDANTRFKLWDQTGTSYLNIEIGNTYYGPGSDLQNVIDLETEKARKTGIMDVAKNITIIDKLPQFDFLMSTGLPSDVPSENLYEEVFKSMVLNSNKPIIITAENSEQIRKTYEIGAKVAGSEKSFKEKPFFMAYLEPVSPLKIEKDIADKVMFCAEKGIPLLFAAGANIAVQAPGTPLGAVTQGTAESLSGLVLSYLVNPNVKFVFGANSADFDPVTGIVSYGGPGWSKTMGYYADIARRLNLPSWGFAGATDSNSIDAQTGFEAALSLLYAELTRPTIVHDVGYLSHGDLTDPRAYLLNAEIIDMVRWLAKGENYSPLDIIKVVDDIVKGEQKTFLGANYTFKNRKENFQPQDWVERNKFSDPQKTLLEKLKDKAYQIWEENPPIVDGDIKTKRSKTAKTEKKTIKVKKEKKKSLEELFQEHQGEPEKVLPYLEESLKKGKTPEDLHSQLVDSFVKCVEGSDGTNLVELLAYVDMLNKTTEPLVAKMNQYNDKKTPLVLGTVETDLHDIGKNLVAQLVDVFGYKVIDKGYDSKTGELILAAIENDASLIGLSALLVNPRENMRKTINCLKELNLKDQVGVIVGGAVINQEFADNIGADAYKPNAQEAAEGLNEIKDKFIQTYERKRIKDEDFIIIGEAINSVSDKVKKAMEQKDKKTILEIARKQVEKGAKYIDVAVSHLGDIKKQKKAIEWTVKLLQKNFDNPLCLDSDDYRIIEAALKPYDTTKDPALINSATLEKERMENMVRLATEYNSNIILQAADGKSLDEKIKMVDTFINYTTEKGLPPEKIFVDPGMEVVAINPESAKTALQTISKLKEKYPVLNFTIGLTNIGYGLGEMARTKALQQAFLKIGKRLGLNSAITRPTILTDDFAEREKALGESIEFIAGITNQHTYNKQLKNPAYDLK